MAEISLPRSGHIPSAGRWNEASEHGLLGVATCCLLDRRQNARHPRRMPRCGLGEDILHIDTEVNRMCGHRTIR